MVMKLSFTSFQKAVESLNEVLNVYQDDPSNTFYRDACIQRFECSYELSVKMLKRYLEMSEASTSSIDALSFSDVIRLANERDLLLSNWEAWRDFRFARNITSHAYDEKKAKEVVKIIPQFYTELLFLLDKLKSKA
jgi:nucleotidyltransferase substrate binding protein (TIGR01987 family)